MNKSPITGYGDNLTVFGTRIGDLSPKEHEEIEMNKGGFNYQPLENVVVSHVQDSSTLICRKPDKNDVEKTQKAIKSSTNLFEKNEKPKSNKS